MYRRVVIRAALSLACAAFLCASASIAADASLPRIVTHDNRSPAGDLNSGTLTLNLEIRKGDWYPEAEDGPHIGVYAFAESGKAPMIPGPLIRVRQRTKLDVTVKNQLQVPMVLHGFCTRPGPDAPVTVGPGEKHRFVFDAGAPGTYFYWAGNPEATIAIGAKRYTDETQLSGAFVVDGPDSRPDERIFVLGLWREETETRAELKEFAVINGRSWPYTERLKLHAGDQVVWHWVNSSTGNHPMHMHGSYYRVLTRGDWRSETVLEPEMQPDIVTELMQPGRTMTMRWVPATPGHWLFHCHLMAHLDAAFSLSHIQGRAPGHGTHSGMVGLVLAIDVEGTPKVVPAAYKQARKLTLEVEPATMDPLQVRLRLRDGQSTLDSDHLVGPPIVLRRGEPAEITVVNHLSEPTAIHWHGMELESYYDGVPGITGIGTQITPRIEPGGKFVARMTPPRAGTFIYHTHWHDIQQLRGGLEGALVVVDDTYDPASEQVVVSAWGPDEHSPLILNGSKSPAPLELTAGKTYRLRLINIGPNVPVLFSLLSGGKPVRWKAVGKDGMELPGPQRIEGAATQLIAVGETYDYEVKVPASGELVLTTFMRAVPGIIEAETVKQVFRIRPLMASQ